MSGQRRSAPSCRGALVAFLFVFFGVGCGSVSTPLEHAYTSRLPVVPIMPSARGIVNVWGRANVATTQDGTGTAPGLSVYSPKLVAAWVSACRGRWSFV